MERGRDIDGGFLDHLLAALFNLGLPHLNGLQAIPVEKATLGLMTRKEHNLGALLETIGRNLEHFKNEVAMCEIHLRKSSHDPDLHHKLDTARLLLEIVQHESEAISHLLQAVIKSRLCVEGQEGPVAVAVRTEGRLQAMPHPGRDITPAIIHIFDIRRPRDIPPSS